MLPNSASETALRDNHTFHRFETALWKELLKAGHDAVAEFLRQQGVGDLGPEVALPDGGTEKLLGLKQSVDSLERQNRRLSERVDAFQESRPAPPAAEEGSVFVLGIDAKGVPMRGAADAPSIESHEHKRGPKTGRKKQAMVAAVYSKFPTCQPEQVENLLPRCPHFHFGLSCLRLPDVAASFQLAKPEQVENLLPRCPQFHFGLSCLRLPGVAASFQLAKPEQVENLLPRCLQFHFGLSCLRLPDVAASFQLAKPEQVENLLPRCPQFHFGLS